MRKQGAIRAEIEVEVPFHDVDLAGVVWHGHYIKYLENARWAVMNRIGFTLEAMLASGYIWPVIGLEVKYIRAARYGERLRVQASIVEWDAKLVLNYWCSAPRMAAASGVRRPPRWRWGAKQAHCSSCLPRV